MTLTMADSIYPASLPAGYDAYAGYVDGRWPTAAALRARFPGARILTLTVFGGGTAADGCDVESGDLTPESGFGWVTRQLDGGSVRPVIYAGAYTMRLAVLPGLAAAGIARNRVRLWSAHYDSPLGPHICSGSTCGEVPEPMDGTQYTDSARGAGGQLIDASLLAADFFGTPPAPSPVPGPTWEEKLMTLLPELKKGSTGQQAVKNWQALLVARGYNLGTSGARKDGIDGSFGAATDSATRAFQAAAKITVDGTVGEKTWTASLTA